MTQATDMRAIVREQYGAIAAGRKSESGCCSPSTSSGGECGCGCGTGDSLSEIGYTAEQVASIPEGANLGLGCGNPLKYAAIQPGETVLDLGSGAGIDCFLAAGEVGPTGHVIGVDMTPQMIEKARANLAKANLENTEFRLGEIEHLPVADESVDVIISNCVVNLSPDKHQVFLEALRVLKPGGRLLVSDIVLTRQLPPEAERDVSLYVGCVAGASLKKDYLALMREAGFIDVQVLSESAFTSSGSLAGDSVASVKVQARKR